MRKAGAALLLLFAISAFAETGISLPKIGFIQDAAGFVRPVYGVAGNFLIGEPIAGSAVSAAFSGSFGFVKTESTITIRDALGQPVSTSDVPAGPALFAFTRDGEPALAYIFTPAVLLRWDGSALLPVSIDFASIAADAVLSIAKPDADHAAMLIQKQDGIWDIRILLATGEVQSQRALPAIAAPACMLANADIVSLDDAGLAVFKADGSVVHLAAQLPDRFSLQQMGDGWLEVRDLASARHFAVRISEDREGFYALPEVSQ